jgi:hypothetical protein
MAPASVGLALRRPKPFKISVDEHLWAGGRTNGRQPEGSARDEKEST